MQARMQHSQAELLVKELREERQGRSTTHPPTQPTHPPTQPTHPPINKPTERSALRQRLAPQQLQKKEEEEEEGGERGGWRREEEEDWVLLAERLQQLGIHRLAAAFRSVAGRWVGWVGRWVDRLSLSR